MSQRKCFSSQRISIRFTVGGLFILATLLTAAIAIGLQFFFTKQIATENALSTYNSISKTVSSHIRDVDEDAIATTRLLSQIGSTGKFASKENENEILQVMAEVMRSNSHFYSLYIASSEDTFFQLINLESSSIVREKIDAKKEDRWVQIKIFNKENKRVKETYYFTDGFKLRYKKEELSNYFPTKRPWYETAGKGEPFKTTPYLFQHLKITGQTYSIIVPNTRSVLGVDIILSSISYEMVNSNLGIANETQKEAFIYKRTGEIIASNKGEAKNETKTEINPLPLTEQEKRLVKKARSLKVSNQLAWEPIDYAVAGKPRGYAIDLLDIISLKTGLKFEYINGFSWFELVHQYNEGGLDILHSVLKTEEREMTQAVSEPLYELPFAVVTKNSKGKILDLIELKDKKVAMLEGWAIISDLKNQFPNMQIITYPSIQDMLTAVKTEKVFAAIETSLIVKHSISQYFIDGLTLHDGVRGFDDDSMPVFHLMMNEKDKEIVDIIDKAIKHISPENRKILNNKWNNAEGNRLTNNTVVPYLPLLTFANDDSYHNQLIEKEIDGIKYYFFVSMITENDFFAVVIPSKLIFSQVNEKILLSMLITVMLMALLLPLAWGFSCPIVKPIRLLEEETLKIKDRDYGSVHQVNTYIAEVWDLSSSIVSMAQELKQHEKAQEEFVEAFIQLIAQAIDDKSPYTAGHCNRVPELGILLASAAEKSTMDAFKSFKFKSEDERREFRIAAWLHDCGKITTPEYIVDKGSKLETNYNRIHEVRMRFEVLWRDAEITYFKQLKFDPEHEAKFKEALIATREKLKDDFSFVAAANVGSEFMSDEHIARIRTISEQTWDRYFDDQLGLSPAEELLITKTSTELPLKELLLSDKKKHIIKRDRKFNIDPKFGIKMDVPEHLYNLGEVYNLTVKRGTLTPEDRFKINEHIISTIKMLDTLPFPPELTRVPRYASTHHETLKGTGYPRKLSREALSIPERILVLADIFEALTASDRPYKKSKPISVSLKIMRNMVLDDHIDKDVFNLFLHSGVYLEYANKYLVPEQIDKVDIDVLLI
ncbi:MAG: transporter substrate-binding domain-containing protein [Aliivibrio sp.]|nr:transporter substrate-binding domain-containing protein [Aliivibrio sp.]